MKEPTKRTGEAKTKETKKSGSWINKVLGLLIVILIAFNVNLYMKKLQNDAIYAVEMSSDSNIEQQTIEQHATANFQTKFIKDTGFAKVMESVGSSKSIKSLVMNVALCSLTNLKPLTLGGFTQLTNRTHQYQQNTQVTLNIGNNPLSNESAVDLANTLMQLTHLTILNLSIDNLFNAEGHQLVLQAISKLKLTHLRISMIHTNLSGNVEFLNSISSISTLKSLDLVLVGCKIKERESQTLGKLIGRLHQLDRLNLNLYANRIVAEGASSLAQGLYFQRGLKEFGLDLFFNNITHVGTESLCSVMKLMSNLTKLEFSLEFNYIQNEGGVMVGDMVSSLPLITSLHLNMATKNFGLIGYQAVVNSIHNLNRLEELNLEIGVNRCGQQGAEDLMNLLLKHNKLRVLKINFNENYVGNQGARFIADGIRAQNNLQELQLVMNFNSLTDVGALEIAKAVQESKHPKIVDLRLTQNEITDKTALIIFNIVDEVLSRVDRFELEMLNTALTNQTRDLIVQKYQNTQKLDLRINTIPPSNWDKEV